MTTAMSAMHIAIDTPYPGRLIISADAETADAVARVARAIAAADISAAIDYAAVAAAMGCARCAARLENARAGVIGIEDIEDNHAANH